jgi:hypothetical protein
MRVALGALVVFLFASVAHSGGPSERYWFCDQAGYVDNQKVLFVSDIYVDKKSNNYAEREKKFEEKIRKENEGFEGFPARCRDHYSQEKAEKFLKIFMETAEKKYNFLIKIINFRY